MIHAPLPKATKRVTKLLVRAILTIVSPTWALAALVKPRDKARRAIVITVLNRLYLFIAIFSITFAIVLLRNDLTDLRAHWWDALYGLWAYFLWSRCAEVFIAFYRDAMDKLRGRPDSSELSGSRRIALALSSYLELIIDFALLQSLITGGMWGNDGPKTLTDMLWMSASTITTSGSGGFVPSSWLPQALSIFEIFGGVILLVVCFTLYANRSIGEPPVINDDNPTNSPKPPTIPAAGLMHGYEGDIGAAAFRVAPERADELNDRIFGGQPWDIEFNDWADPKSNTFRVLPNIKKIQVNYAALASLWAVAKAAWLVASTAMVVARNGATTLDANPNSPVHESLLLIDQARRLIRNAAEDWPDTIVPPCPSTAAKTEDWYVNNVFLAAVGWILLHEIAHVDEGHQETVSSDVSFRQEHRADLWAAKWVLDQTAAGDMQGCFRVFAISVALSWLALIDGERQGSTTHPHAWQRFAKLNDVLPYEDLNPGYEMASYVLKVLFLPDAPPVQTDCPQEAFFELLRQANQLSR